MQDATIEQTKMHVMKKFACNVCWQTHLLSFTLFCIRIYSIINQNDLTKDLVDISGGARLKEALVNNYKHLVNEIEPRTIRQMFVERREIKAKEFDLICRMATRRQRAIRLMKIILNEKSSVWKCFLDALELAGCKNLVTLIRNEMGTFNIHCYNNIYNCKTFQKYN